MRHDDESGPIAGELTPEIGAATDVAPVGLKTKPGHELTAAEDSDPVDWSRVTQMPEFRSMVSAKLRFIIPAVVFFVVYYFRLPFLVGFAPVLLRTNISGFVNIPYLFDICQS